LVGDIAKFIFAAAPRPVAEIALAGAIGLMSGVCGRAYNISATGLNQYTIVLGKTGRGKEAIASGIDRLMQSIKFTVPTSANFIGPGDISSGQALVRYINANPCFVSILGEFGLRLKSMSDANANSSEINLRKMLLDLFNKSGFGQTYKPSIYSKSTDSVPTTQAPSFSIVAESTPKTFYENLNEDMITEGLLPRFNIIEYTGKRPEYNENHASVQPSMSLIDRFGSLVAMCEQIMHAKRVINVEASPEAKAIMYAFDKHCDRYINDDSINDVVIELWNRAHMKALKLSALIAIGVNMADPVVTTDYANWAIAFVINNIQFLSSKFEQGQIGHSTSEIKQVDHMKHMIREFLSRDDIATKYKVDEKLFKDKIIPGSYLQRRLAAQTSYRLDRLGSTLAIRRSVQVLIDQDILREIPVTQMVEKYGTRQKAYAVSNARALGD
jgi:hypothetical protein